MNDWRASTWRREHATHGTFLVEVYESGAAIAQRVQGARVERLGGEGTLCANLAHGMIAVEQRIAELDRELLQKSLADTRWLEMIA